MSRFIVAAAALLFGAFAGSAHGARVIEQVEKSVELSLGDLTLPASPTGTVRYRTCATCALVSRAVREATTYRLNDRVLPFTEFVAEVERLRSLPSVEARGMAFVYYDLQTKVVNRVVVRAGNP